ncbi:hypothetical protein PSTT_13297 [Puccinia striiformis]|uniref:Uncharacterized protein n=2 Tax=Puccinia striiformis TaxID=27350 RepID=A0A2S4USU6_9BASI|nr:hypothetical protein PSTT_13297 [Puccinia striiformis]
MLIVQHILAQTTDSGSNNFTMASEVDWLLLKDTGIDPNLTENHVQCMCHKIALILNAGLQSIQISSKGFVPTQLDILGLVPGIAPIIEESKEVEEAACFVGKDVILGSNNDQEDHNTHSDER